MGEGVDQNLNQANVTQTGQEVDIEAILDGIRTQAEAEISAIEAGLQVQEESILEQARLQAEQRRQQTFKEASADADRERAHLLSEARLRAIHIRSEVRQDLVGRALAQVRENLAKFRQRDEYPQVLGRLAREALDSFTAQQKGDKLYIQADERDRELLEEILAANDLEVEISYDRECWGGLVVKSSDTRIVVDNTLEARLARAHSYLIRSLPSLFE